MALKICAGCGQPATIQPPDCDPLPHCTVCHGWHGEQDICLGLDEYDLPKPCADCGDRADQVLALIAWREDAKDVLCERCYGERCRRSP
jgi:hypothetical protein